MSAETLTLEEFLEVVNRAPLISIDLIVRRPDGSILLGHRNNQPAKGKWFVPGGRVRKGESLDRAFERISSTELGANYTRAEAQRHGVYEHLYKESFQDHSEFGTHYVVLAYEVWDSKVPPLEDLPLKQHKVFDWFTEAAATSNKEVHPHVHPYFDSHLHDNAFQMQYAALNGRRDALNSLLWQTPALSLTAQAFLFTIALDPGASAGANRLAAALALATALASVQLLSRHRLGEVEHAKWLDRLETHRGLIRINKKLTSSKKFRNPKTWPSYWVWAAMLGIFAAGALFVLADSVLGWGLLNKVAS